MRIPIYQVDAFTDRLFSGNPAAVCPLDQWPKDQVLQNIAAENNLAETAFFVREGDGYRLRWFTPKLEVDLCGHATLASAFILFTKISPSPELREVRFQSKSGPLVVRKDGELLVLDFPSRPPVRAEAPEGMIEALGRAPLEVWKGVRDHLLIFGSEAEVRAIAPDFGRLSRVEHDGLIVSARGDAVDFVSRFFAVHYGIDEDPVTGSAHCTLAPFWASRLSKSTLSARQISARGGDLRCTVSGDRVMIGGRAVLYLEGSAYLE